MGRSVSPSGAARESEDVKLSLSCPNALIAGVSLCMLTNCQGPDQIPIGAAVATQMVLAPDGQGGVPAGGEAGVFVDDGEAGVPIPVDGAAAATFFISPTGNDSGPGTRAQPWRTFGFAVPRLAPGTTLVLLDGIYEGATSGYPNIRCGTNATSGTAGSPITLVADHERAALLKGDASGPPFFMQGCSYWVVEGLHAESGDFANAPAGATGGSIFVVDTNNAHVVLRRLLGAHTNRYRDSLGLYVGDGSSDVIVEECELYDFHFHGFEASHGAAVVFRRNYVNSRNTIDIPVVDGGYGTLDPARGDHGLHLWETQSAIAENNVFESVRNGAVVKGGETAVGSSTGNRLLGNVVINPALSGFLLDSHQCATPGPCPEQSRIVVGTQLTDDVTIGGATGIRSNGTVDTVIDRFSSIGAASGVMMEKPAYNGAVVATSSTVNSLVADFTVVGFSSTGETTWVFDHCAATTMGVGPPFLPNASPQHVTNTVTLDPALAGCLAYLPPASPLRGAGAGARDVGAEVVYRYENGLLTATRLWDAVTGAFPCGATVPGMNDDPTQSCVGVHQRLHVGSGGCPPPP
jgi:hypothetical protein